MSGVGGLPDAGELEPEHTEGFKVGEKKTIDEYHKLGKSIRLYIFVSTNNPNDAQDESLKKWKASLGLGTGDDLSDPKDPRKVIIFSLGLEVQGRPDIIIDLNKPGALETLDKQPFTIKEGATFRMKARFKVQHQILSGLKYVQVVSRMGVKNKMQEMIGSYSPNTSDRREYEKKFESETAPTGMLGRGHYEAVSKFIDDDNQTHLQFKWSFDIRKDWQ